MSFGDHVEALGRHVAAGWRARNEDRDAFPDLAAEAIERFGVPEVDTTALLADLLRGPLPVKRGFGVRFGQPPVRLYEGHDFYIEALYWFAGTTAIHEHTFFLSVAGATRDFRASNSFARASAYLGRSPARPSVLWTVS